MKKQYLSILVFSMIATQNTRAETCNSMADLEIFLGEWHAEDSHDITTESWTKVSDRSFEGGASVTDKSGRLKSTEALRIVEMSNEVFYIAKVDANEFPTSFKLTSCTHGSFTFENPEHDFPKKLLYDFKTANTLDVTVSGNANDMFEIHFRKLDFRDN